MSEIAPGKYQSSGFISGKEGVGYWITVKTSSGAEIESEPTTIQPTGTISSIRYEFEKRTKLTETGQTDASVFSVYVDPVEMLPSMIIVSVASGTLKVISETHPVITNMSPMIQILLKRL